MNCKNNNNCYYKQLKRLEQENKELKERFEKRGELMCNCAKQRENYRSALEEIREKAQHCIKQDVCVLCDYSKECAVPDADGLVYDNNRLLIKLINEVLNV